jgi:hypothetical protein
MRWNSPKSPLSCCCFVVLFLSASPLRSEQVQANPSDHLRAWNTLAKMEFSEKDKNRDKKLKRDEMDGQLRKDRDDWDNNNDDIITIEEYKLFYHWQVMKNIEKRKADAEKPPSNKRNNKSAAEKKSWDALPVVYRVGNLPKEIPPWFIELDKNVDAQVGLFEWRESKLSLEDFSNLDRNGDNLLTVEELLYFITHAAPGTGTSR